MRTERARGITAWMLLIAGPIEALEWGHGAQTTELARVFVEETRMLFPLRVAPSPVHALNISLWCGSYTTEPCGMP
eukprot:scaffold307581_cov33-Tisochrysis_lutea.AAC.1